MKWLMLSIALVSSTPAYAALTGNGYLGLPEEQQVAFVNGLRDGFTAGASLHGGVDDPRYKKLTDCMNPWPGSQLHAIVKKYLASKPADWGNLMVALWTRAVSSACGNPYQFKLP